MPDRSPNNARVSHLPTSMEMTDHLIGKYDLYGHYEINAAHPLHYERASDRLVNSITVRHPDDNSMMISVEDEDPVLAADMANAIFAKLKEINERQVMADLERKIALYQQVIDHTERRSKEQAAQLMDLGAELERLIGKGRSLDPGNNQLAPLNFQLAQLVAQLSVANEDLSNARKTYEISAALMKEQDLPDVYLVRGAVQDLTTSKVRVWVSTLVFAFFATFVLSLGVLVLWFKYRHD